MIDWYAAFVYAERRKDALEARTHAQLVQAAKTAHRQTSPLSHRMLAWSGRQLITLGTALKTRGLPAETLADSRPLYTTENDCYS